ncbi:MAG: hypothetical protein ACUVRZ_01565 [Desulfobacca sp.]|uniref:hypothetical protein n=1 Tax=Desulfobacca sp. TaxID=2067990 RepID=UPI0040497488
MTVSGNYRSRQMLLNLVIFALLALAMLNGNWLVTVGAVLAATAVALYAATTQPAPPADDHSHH